jgi:hypothetical protein
LIAITLHPVLAAIVALQQTSGELVRELRAGRGAAPASLTARSLRQLNVRRPDRGYRVAAKPGWRMFQWDELSA